MKSILVLCTIVSFARASYHQVYHFEPAPLNHDGTVADTPEVAAAKHAHLEALAKAGGATHVYAPHYGGQQHYSDGGHYYKKWFTPAPLNHDGTVADTPEIKHAKAVHFAAHAEALSRLHYSHSPSIHTTYAHNLGHSPLAYSYYAPYHQPAPLNHDGTVADTPEVKHAKAEHFAAHAAARSYYPHHYVSHYIADTPEVEHAKALHFAAYHEALHRGKRSAHPVYAPAYSGKYHGPPAPLKHDGTVDDTPEVKHAKAEHFAAHAQAKLGVKPGPAQYAEPVYHHSVQALQPVYSNFAHVEPFYHQTYEPVYQIHEPIEPIYHSVNSYEPYYQEPAPLNHDGTVADTPDVLARKYEHFNEHAKALSRVSHDGLSHYYS